MTSDTTAETTADTTGICPAPRTSSTRGTHATRRTRERPPAPAVQVYPMIARVAAVLTPLGVALAAASTLADPTSPEPEPRGMYVAYGADPAGVDIAATLLHQGVLAMGVGLLLAGLAPAAGRGRVLAGVGGALAAIGFLDLSGTVVEDWLDAHLSALLGPDQAMALGQAALDAPGFSVGVELPVLAGATVGPIVLTAGLARAGLLPWWILALPVLAAGLFPLVDAIGPLGFPAMLAVHGVLAVLLGRALGRAATGRPPV
jgi:hypothetical protein